MNRVGGGGAGVLALCSTRGMARGGGLLAAVLPSSRSTVINQPTTVFATILNTSGHDVDGCTIATSQAGVTLSYQPTDPTTNQPIGTANVPVKIAAHRSQSFVLTLVSSIPLT